MGKKKYDELMKTLCFIKIQNDTIIQLLLDDEKYKRSAYKTIQKEMIKYWEDFVNEEYNKVDD